MRLCVALCSLLIHMLAIVLGMHVCCVYVIALAVHGYTCDCIFHPACLGIALSRYVVLCVSGVSWCCVCCAWAVFESHRHLYVASSCTLSMHVSSERFAFVLF